MNGHTVTAYYWSQRTGHVPTAAIRGPEDRPRPHGDHTISRELAKPPRHPYGAQGTSHAPKAAIRGQGDRPHPHGGHARPRGPAMPPRRPYGRRGPATPPRKQNGDRGSPRPTASIRGPVNRPRPTTAIRAQRTGHAQTAAVRGPRGTATLPRGHTGPRGQATPPQRPYGPSTGHAPMAAIQGSEDRPLPTAAIRAQEAVHAPTATIQGPGERPRHHGGHTGPRGPATTPWRPCRAQGTNHTPRRPNGVQRTGCAPTVAIRDPADRPHQHGGDTRSKTPATPLRQPYSTRGPAMPPRRTCGAQGTGHAPTAAIRGLADQPRLHGNHTWPRVTATPLRRPYGA